MKGNLLKKTVSMALAVTMCSSIAYSSGFLTKVAELEEIDDYVVDAESAEVQGNLVSEDSDFLRIVRPLL